MDEDLVIMTPERYIVCPHCDRTVEDNEEGICPNCGSDFFDDDDIVERAMKNISHVLRHKMEFYAREIAEELRSSADEDMETVIMKVLEPMQKYIEDLIKDTMEDIIYH